MNSEFSNVLYRDGNPGKGYLYAFNFSAKTISLKYAVHEDISIPYFLSGAREDPYFLEYLSPEGTPRPQGVTAESPEIMFTMMKGAFSSLQLPTVFKHNNQTFLIGKGFFATLSVDGVFTPLMVVTFPEDSVFSYKKSTLFVDKSLFKNPELLILFKLLITAIKWDPKEVIIKENILDDIASPYEPPTFKSIAERQAFIEKVVDEAFEDFL